MRKPAVGILCCHREERLPNRLLQGFWRARSHLLIVDRETAKVLIISARGIPCR
jgi:hypothetical protein